MADYYTVCGRKHTTEEHTTGEHYCVQLEKKKLGEGVSRVAYKGEILEPEKKKGEKVVVKRFKPQKLADQYRWFADIETSMRASELATEFNGLGNFVSTVKFVVPQMITVDEAVDYGGEVVPMKAGDAVLLEPYLSGTYEKWLSNTGQFNLPPEEILVTFSHWTWHKTNRDLVCDLQGVRDDSGHFLLTDPAIHSLEQRYGQYYGSSDLGRVGVRLFRDQHSCTSLCKTLQLSSPRVAADGVAEPQMTKKYCRPNTLYASELPLQELIQKFYQ